MRVKLHENVNMKLEDVMDIHPEIKAKMAASAAKGAKEAYERVKKEMQERQQKEENERSKLMADSSVSRTEKLRQKEVKKVVEVEAEMEEYYEDGEVYMGSNEYKFELEPHVVEDFIMKMTVDHPILLSAFVYINTDGVYSRTRNVSDEGPLRLRITDNQYHLVS